MRMSTVTVESQSQPGMLVHASNPSAQEAEVGQSGVPLGHLANSCLKTKCKTTATTTTTITKQQSNNKPQTNKQTPLDCFPSFNSYPSSAA